MKKIIFFFLLICGIVSVNAQTNKFSWIAWEKVPQTTKNELKKIKYDETQSVYTQILLDFKDSKEAESTLNISIALIDLDRDGKMGYAVGYSGSLFCGSGGCQFAVYENSGKTYLSFNDDWERIKPAKNGVISSSGKFFHLEKSLY
jgi:hypothetical protein